MWSESDIRDELKKVNARLAFLNQNHTSEDSNPYGYGTVADAKSRLRRRKKQLQERLNEIKADWAYDRARNLALSRIFNRDNNGIYPSDIGQDWSWRTENDVVYCVIDGKEFSEPIELNKK